MSYEKGCLSPKGHRPPPTTLRRRPSVGRVFPQRDVPATTILALLPVLTSTGRGAEVMIPMAIPSFGGMLIELMTLFLVPVLYCSVQELRWYRRRKR